MRARKTQALTNKHFTCNMEQRVQISSGNASLETTSEKKEYVRETVCEAAKCTEPNTDSVELSAFVVNV